MAEPLRPAPAPTYRAQPCQECGSQVRIEERRYYARVGGPGKAFLKDVCSNPGCVTHPDARTHRGQVP